MKKEHIEQWRSGSMSQEPYETKFGKLRNSDVIPVITPFEVRVEQQVRGEEVINTTYRFMDDQGTEIIWAVFDPTKIVVDGDTRYVPTQQYTGRKSSRLVVARWEKEKEVIVQKPWICQGGHGLG